MFKCIVVKKMILQYRYDIMYMRTMCCVKKMYYEVLIILQKW